MTEKKKMEQKNVIRCDFFQKKISNEKHNVLRREIYLHIFCKVYFVTIFQVSIRFRKFTIG